MLWHTFFIGRCCPAALEAQGSSSFIAATLFSPVRQLRGFGPGPPSTLSPQSLTLPAPWRLRACPPQWAWGAGEAQQWHPLHRVPHHQAHAGVRLLAAGWSSQAWVAVGVSCLPLAASPRAWSLPLAAPPRASCLPLPALRGIQAWHRWQRTCGSHWQGCNTRCMQLGRTTSKSAPCTPVTTHRWQYAPSSTLTHGPGLWPWLGCSDPIELLTMSLTKRLATSCGGPMPWHLHQRCSRLRRILHRPCWERWLFESCAQTVNFWCGACRAPTYCREGSSSNSC
jgi:hypothetical protein